MQLFKSIETRKNFLKLILKIMVGLVIIQILRAAIMGTLWFVVPHPVNDLTIFQLFNGLSFILVGLILIFYFKPSLKELGLNLNDLERKTRIIYLLGVLFLVFMAVTPYFLGWEISILVIGMISGLVIPAFEELLFRGYIWNQIQESKDMVNSGVLTWIIVTLLFSIWHLGYIDVFLIHPMGPGNIPMLLISKMGIGLILGLIVGFLRLKTGKVYASFIFHGFWNVFAP
ncbi:MAG: CPBP family intramembrane metalloprotease [Methanobacterium paludis]|nr:CPBP family intramembrane metalloprotease [Methanobacterium paludis]